MTDSKARAAAETEAIRLTQGQVAALDALIERLIAFRDIIDGDTDKEIDDEDRCSAHDDSMEVPELNAGFGLPGDPDDAEEDDPIEDNHDAEEMMYAEPRKRRTG
jgi:hypothetical protein